MLGSFRVMGRMPAGVMKWYGWSCGGQDDHPVPMSITQRGFDILLITPVPYEHQIAICYLGLEIKYVYGLREEILGRWSNENK